MTLQTLNMKQFRPGEFMGDSVIRLYTKLLQVWEDPSSQNAVILDPMYYPMMLATKTSPERLAPVREAINRHRLIFLPANANGEHWILLVIDSEQRHVLVWDSIPKIGQCVPQQVLKLLDTLLPPTSSVVNRQHLQSMIPCYKQPSSREQGIASNDCLLYVLQSLEALYRNRATIDWNAKTVYVDDFIPGGVAPMTYLRPALGDYLSGLRRDIISAQPLDLRGFFLSSRLPRWLLTRQHNTTAQQ